MEKKSSIPTTLRNRISLNDQLLKDDIVELLEPDHLGSSHKDLIDLVSSFRKKFVSLKDFIVSGPATGRFTFNIFASLEEFEREIIRERTMAVGEKAQCLCVSRLTCYRTLGSWRKRANQKLCNISASTFVIRRG